MRLVLATAMLCLSVGAALAYPINDILRAPPVHHDVRSIITDAALAEGVPLRTALAVAKVESGFNPRAHNAGALGLFQIKCRTARGLGFTGPCSALFDPRVNARWGVKHVALALRRGSVGFHQTGLHARGVTRAYVSKINAAMR